MVCNCRYIKPFITVWNHPTQGNVPQELKIVSYRKSKDLMNEWWDTYHIIWFPWCFCRDLVSPKIIWIKTSFQTVWNLHQMGILRFQLMPQMGAGGVSRYATVSRCIRLILSTNTSKNGLVSLSSLKDQFLRVGRFCPHTFAPKLKFKMKDNHTLKIYPPKS